MDFATPVVYRRVFVGHSARSLAWDAAGSTCRGTGDGNISEHNAVVLGGIGHFDRGYGLRVGKHFLLRAPTRFLMAEGCVMKTNVGIAKQIVVACVVATGIAILWAIGAELDWNDRADAVAGWRVECRLVLGRIGWHACHSNQQDYRWRKSAGRPSHARRQAVAGGRRQLAQAAHFPGLISRLELSKRRCHGTRATTGESLA